MTDSDFEVESTEDLRVQAFAKAKKHYDVGFFWDLVRHLPHAPEAEDVDGSLGSVGPAIDSVLQLWHELTANSRDYGDAEPLLRARFIDYLSDDASASAPD